MTTLDQLMGLNASHIDSDSFEVPVNADARMSLNALKKDAKKAGFDLAFASGFRSFERQKTIWNAKASGRQGVLDATANPVDITVLSDDDKMRCILHWSALPGASRHHWGSEVDIYDKSALGESKLELTLAETQQDGVFHDMYRWLDIYLPSRSDIRRPYTEGVGNIAIEPWHISVTHTAQTFETLSTHDVLLGFIQSRSDIALYKSIVAHFEYIYKGYISPYFIGK